VDSLKVLDPERPIREATELLRRREMTRGAINDCSCCSLPRTINGRQSDWSAHRSWPAINRIAKQLAD